ncbi:AfsR/SARP family transcriptional regulator [Amycolatopsis aidingensis]|uniref:AfsR/SARP family transcriptional regulator n=1 Tax=Amycolatopsis aidingensis TaxID=2842453 RepID=UPI001C0E4425|nr:AfsR/SARP family transcriptional regulator [Amycolatopsis aidingensis]
MTGTFQQPDLVQEAAPRLRILGPLEVEGLAAPVHVTAPRQRVLLAMLLLGANQVISNDRLADAVWGGSPPNTVRSQIQICVAALRQQLAETRLGTCIETKPQGYLLRTADHELDAHIFERFAEAGHIAAKHGDHMSASAAYRSALALWRGTPLEDIDSPVVQAALVRLVEQRMTVIEDCFRVELELGRHHQLIGELKQLVAQNPLRERLRVLLMLGLHRAGRKAEALEEYLAARRVLMDELGLEPSLELRELERGILADDPGLMLPADVEVRVPRSSAPSMLPSDISDFTGREQFMARSRQYLVSASHTRATPILAITGGGGVGKSAAAVHLAHQVTTAFPDGVLYADLGGSSDRADASEILLQFLRALGVPDERIPARTAERAALYRTTATGKRVLVLLDDAVDERQVEPLLPGHPSSGVVITSRARLVGLPGARLFSMEALDRHDALRLLGTLVGRERVAVEPKAAQELVERCDALPLALRIAATRLTVRPHWTIEQIVRLLADGTRRLDVLAHGGLSVRASIEVTYRRLDAQAKRLLLRLASLEDSEFDAGTATSLLGLDELEATNILETLVDAYLVRVVRGTAGETRYRLSGLVRAFAAEPQSVQGRAARQARDPAA